MRLALCLAVPFLRCCSAQRAYLCDRVDAVKNGSLTQADALTGIHLSIGTGVWDERFLRWDPLFQRWSGLEVELLDQLSLSAGFTYQLVINDWSNVTNWRRKLREAVLEWDVVAHAWWFITPVRMSLGAYSPYGFLDSMFYTVVVPEEVARLSMNEIFSFLTPFSGAVWLCFLLLMIATGLIFRFLEAGHNEEDYPDGPRGFFHRAYISDSIFKSSGHITGASGFAPKTWPGKILVTSWTWCIVLTLSAYTANLASFLVVKNENAAGFTSLQSAVIQQKTVSVQGGTPMELWFDQKYPDYPHVQRLAMGPVDRARRLVDRTSDAAIFPKFEFDILKQHPEINAGCNLKFVGEPLLNIQAGWMVLNDVRDKCTILVRDVLAVHFLNLDLTGELAQLTQRHLVPFDTCPVAVEQGVEEASKLEIENMLGILSVHAFGVLLAVIFDIIDWSRNRVAKRLTNSWTQRASNSEAPSAVPEEPDVEAVPQAYKMEVAIANTKDGPVPEDFVDLDNVEGAVKEAKTEPIPAETTLETVLTVPEETSVRAPPSLPMTPQVVGAAREDSEVAPI
ncbi:unnamed protein product [Effrenium voratum]|uniref:Ionotropic glutamate receptor C-terminal domain-containing protein n=1 Tax=Effrenium voratum TaxID=2562239 RepID=A0AA36IM69_9DINO|nr:unnamed protein product [Effrenium voratum]